MDGNFQLVTGAVKPANLKKELNYAFYNAASAKIIHVTCKVKNNFTVNFPK